MLDTEAPRLKEMVRIRNKALPRLKEIKLSGKRLLKGPLSYELIGRWAQDVKRGIPTSFEELIAWIILKCNGISQWVIAIQVSEIFVAVLYLPWRYARTSPLDGMETTSPRCMACGWFSGNMYGDEERCDECHNAVVCEGCSYRSPWDGRLRCAMCPPRPVDPPFFHALNYLAETTSGALDAIEMAGPGFDWQRSAVQRKSRGCCALWMHQKTLFLAWKSEARRAVAPKIARPS